MAIVGLILLLLGIFLSIKILLVIGLVLLIVGAAIWIAASVGHGRPWY
jgi:hypothetical protein